MQLLIDIYNILLTNYKSQGWWPVTEENSHIPQYFVKIATEKQILEIIFGSILTQNTSWKNVETVIEQLNKKSLIDIDKILKMNHEELAKIIKSSGYYNEKTKKLKEVCKFLKQNSIYELSNYDMDSLRQELLNVKGIGPETADSIILYAFKKPKFVIDAYTRRILTRIGIADKKSSYDELQSMFENSLDKDMNIYNEYHALIVEHAKRYCRKKPLCGTCILSHLCEKKI
jgi:endonuclease-3 related protein